MFDASLIVASIWINRDKRQLRRPLPSNGHGHLRTETRSITAEGIDRIRDRAVGRYDHVHQEAPAIRGRRNVLDKHIVEDIASITIG